MYPSHYQVPCFHGGKLCNGPRVLCTLRYGCKASASILHGVSGLAGGDDTEKKAKTLLAPSELPEKPCHAYGMSTQLSTRVFAEAVWEVVC